LPELGKLHELLLPKMWGAMYFHQSSTCAALQVDLSKKANSSTINMRRDAFTGFELNVSVQ
jgi:hypothetical protein